MTAQVYATGRIIAKPPRTPLYLLLVFYLANIASGLADCVATVLSSMKEPGIIILDALRATFPTIILWVAGTLPLEDVLPSPNVATEKDVRFQATYTASTHIVSCTGA